MALSRLLSLVLQFIQAHTFHSTECVPGLVLKSNVCSEKKLLHSKYSSLELFEKKIKINVGNVGNVGIKYFNANLVVHF